MAIETVEAVRQAENRAEEKEKTAQKEKQVILATAQKEARELEKNSLKEATEKSKKNLQKAQLDGQSIINNTVKKAEEEVANLRNSIKEKEQKAIDLVISQIT